MLRAVWLRTCEPKYPATYYHRPKDTIIHCSWLYYRNYNILQYTFVTKIFANLPFTKAISIPPLRLALSIITTIVIVMVMKMMEMIMMMMMLMMMTMMMPRTMMI